MIHFEHHLVDYSNNVSVGRQCCVSYFLKVTCYSYKLLHEKSNLLQLLLHCKCNKLLYKLLDIYFLLHHLNPNPNHGPNAKPTLILTRIDSITYRSAISETFNDTVLKSTFPSLHILLTASKITLLYNFNAAVHLGKCKLK